jgi:hypothetical protein
MKTKRIISWLLTAVFLFGSVTFVSPNESLEMEEVQMEEAQTEETKTEEIKTEGPEVTPPPFAPVFAPFSLACVPEYCTNLSCTYDPLGADCTCPDTCPCRTVVLNPCVNHGFCTNAACLCKDSGAHLCICGNDCLCHFPPFTAVTNVYITGSPHTEMTIATGAVRNVNLIVTTLSHEATFKDITIRTFVQEPLVPFNIDIFGPVFELVAVNTGVPGVEPGSYTDTFTEIVVRSRMEGAASGTFEFDVRFPAGVVPGGVDARIFSIMEGTVICQTTQVATPFGMKQGTRSDHDVVFTSAADTDWHIELQNVDLDYRYPDDLTQRIFRQEIKLSRTSASGNGVLYLRQDETALTIVLPLGVSTPGQILRLTDTFEPGGVNIAYTAEMRPYEVSTGVFEDRMHVDILPQNIPFNGSFAATSPGVWNPTSAAWEPAVVTQATNALVYIVFEIDPTELVGIPTFTVDDFTFYQGIFVEAVFDYNIATTLEPNKKEAREAIGVITFNPARHGHGSISKSANSFIDGRNFYGAPTAPHTPIRFNINYHNSAASPVHSLVITDRLPRMETLQGFTAFGSGLDTGFASFSAAAFSPFDIDAVVQPAAMESFMQSIAAANISLEKANPVPADAIRFHRITVNQFTPTLVDNLIPGSTPVIFMTLFGADDVIIDTQPILPNVPFAFEENNLIQRIDLEVRGSLGEQGVAVHLMHGFRLGALLLE